MGMIEGIFYMAFALKTALAYGLKFLD